MKCECGGESVGGGHSDWCPKHSRLEIELQRIADAVAHEWTRHSYDELVGIFCSEDFAVSGDVVTYSEIPRQLLR
jgi:hypothetical protein